MVIGISPDNEAFLDRVVATGQFPTREAALNEGVRQLRDATAHAEQTSATSVRFQMEFAEARRIAAGQSPGEPLPPSIVQPAKYQNLEQWMAAFKRWNASHQDVTAIADDSRDSIY